jgi:hypothetical protein
VLADFASNQIDTHERGIVRPLPDSIRRVTYGLRRKAGNAPKRSTALINAIAGGLRLR